MPTDDIWSEGPARRPGRRARTDASDPRPPAGRQDGPPRVAGQHDPRTQPPPGGPYGAPRGGPYAGPPPHGPGPHGPGPGPGPHGPGPHPGPHGHGNGNGPHPHAAPGNGAYGPPGAGGSYGNGTYGTGAHGQVPPGPGGPGYPPRPPAQRPPQTPPRGMPVQGPPNGIGRLPSQTGRPFPGQNPGNPPSPQGPPPGPPTGPIPPGPARPPAPGALYGQPVTAQPPATPYPPSSPYPGNPGTPPNGYPRLDPPTGGFSTTGGFPTAGGIPASGGIPANGGIPASGGYPAGPGAAGYATGAHPTVYPPAGPTGYPPTGPTSPAAPTAGPGAPGVYQAAGAPPIYDTFDTTSAGPAAPSAPIVDGFDTAAFGLDRPSTGGAGLSTAFEGGPFGAGGTFPAAGGALDPDDQVAAFAPREVEPDQPEPKDDDHHHLSAFRKIRSHAKQRRVPRFAVIMLILGVVVVGAGLRFVPGSPFADSGGEETRAAVLSAMPLHDADVTATSVGTQGFLSWAFMDRRDGTVTGAPNMSNTSDSASMIKVWLAADFLKRAADQNQQPNQADLTDLEIMIRDSDNAAADRIVGKLGGAPQTVGRLISTCQLTETKAGDVWGATMISARDAVRMGGCLSDGRAAGAQWTPWILEKMRTVRGEGDFGIRKAFPAAVQPMIAIKNGWALRAEDNSVHANCLAIGDTWVLVVMQRYPSTGDFARDMQHVDSVCQDVTRALTT